MTLFIEIATLVGIALDLISTIALGCLGGQCRSNCCGSFFSFEHNEDEEKTAKEV